MSQPNPLVPTGTDSGPAPLVVMHNGAPTTTTLVVAEGTQNLHASVLRLVRDNLSDFEEFGRVGFEIQPFATAGGMQRREVAVLNEEQATLLLTYMRNAPVVKDFKKRLVREFWAMRRSNMAPMPPSGPDLFAHAVLEAQKMIAAKDAQIAQLDGKLAAAAPKLEYLDRHVAENDDVVTIEAWGHLYGLTEPKAFELLRGKDIIYRHLVGKRWSASKQRLVCEYEHLPYGDCIDWFSRRPQHDAPRHHNGQVRMTLYVKVFHSEDIARKAGLVGQMTLPEDQEGQP